MHRTDTSQSIRLATTETKIAVAVALTASQTHSRVSSHGHPHLRRLELWGGPGILRTGYGLQSESEGSLHGAGGCVWVASGALVPGAYCLAIVTS